MRWWGGGFDATGGPGRRLAMVFQTPTLMPWARIDGQRAAAARPRRRTARRRRARCRCGAGAGRSVRFRAPFPARAVGRHADARVDRPRARHRAGPAADGRAVRRARRIHAAAPRRRAAGAVGRARLDRRLRHPQHRRGGVPVDPRRGDGRAPGPRAGRGRDRRALPAHRRVPAVAGVRRAMPAAVGTGRRRGGGRARHEGCPRRRRRACCASPRRSLVAIVALALWQALVVAYDVPRVPRALAARGAAHAGRRPRAAARFARR